MKMAWAVMMGVLMGASVWAQTVPATSPATQGVTTTSRPARTTTRGKPVYVTVARVVAADNDDSTKRVANRLRERMPELHLQDQALAKAVQYIGIEQEINFAVNWGDLKRAGVDRDMKITLDLAEVSWAQALRLLLEDAAPGKLDFIIREGVVEVATKEWWGRQVDMRKWDPKRLSEKPFDPASDEKLSGREKRLAELVAALAAPEAWTVKGNVIMVARGELVVSAPPRALWEVAEVWDALQHPIHVPAAKPEAAAEMKASGEPVKFPAYLAGKASKVAAQALQRTPKTEWVPGTVLAEELARWQKAFGLNMAPNWRSLADAGVTPDRKISYQAPGLPAEACLRAILTSARAESKTDLGYLVTEEGVVVVAAGDALAAEPAVGIFDVRDLARRQIFLAAGAKPTPTEAVAAVRAALEQAAAEAGWSKQVQILEYEGLIAVRGAAEYVRMAGRYLGGLGK